MSYSGDLRPPGGIPNGREPAALADQPAVLFAAQQNHPAQAHASRLYPSAADLSVSSRGYPQQQEPMSLQRSRVANPTGDAEAGDDEDRSKAARRRAISSIKTRRGSARRTLIRSASLSAARAYRAARCPAAAAAGRRRGSGRTRRAGRIVGPVAFKPAATLACPLVSALDRWIMDAIQPAAMRWFNQPVVEIKQISAYSCRGMNGNPNARISEHAFGNALDISAFTLADGRRISVKDGWRGLPEEQGFLRDVQGAACQMFTTVLAPGSNVYHYDHIHVDLMRRSSGRGICNPAAVSGETIAARAGGRFAGRDTGVTGSIGPQAPADVIRRGSDDDWIEDESNIRDNGR